LTNKAPIHFAVADVGAAVELESSPPLPLLPVGPEVRAAEHNVVQSLRAAMAEARAQPTIQAAAAPIFLCARASWAVTTALRR
jgi:hypothetical protein